jgi:hypothetical protein
MARQMVTKRTMLEREVFRGTSDIPLKFYWIFSEKVNVISIQFLRVTLKTDEIKFVGFLIALLIAFLVAPNCHHSSY